MSHTDYAEIIRENRAIKARISSWTNKQERLKRKQTRVQELEAKKIEQEQLKYKIIQCFKFKPKAETQLSAAEIDEIERKKSEK